ncbi:MAG: CHAT domain-containing protein [Calditrichaeota bacterium]|nr:MAG: CHAT domain-containing protein [Calditrichota bacterium]
MGHSPSGMRLVRNLLSILILLSCCQGFLRAHSEQIPPGGEEDEFLAALKLLGKGQQQIAIEKLEQLILLHPEFYPPYKKLAEVYIQIDQVEQGIDFFQQIRNRNSKNPYVYYALARIAYEQGDFQKALEHMKQCIVIDPEYPELYGPKGIAETFKLCKQLNEGRTFFRNLLKQHPQNPYFHLGLGRIHIKMLDWEKALGELYQANELDSTILYIPYSIAYIYQVTGQYHNSLKQYQKLLRLALKEKNMNLVAYGLMQIGTLYYFVGNYGKSLKFYNESYKVAREYGEQKRKGMALTNMGSVYSMVGNYEKGLKYFKLAYQILEKTGAERTRAILLYNIGLIHKDTGHYQEAFPYFERALKLTRERHFQLEESMVLGGIAENHLALNDLEKALTYYLEALHLAEKISNPYQQCYILRNLGSIYQKREEYTRAISNYSKALSIAMELNDAQVIWESNSGLGACYQKLGEPTKAIAHFSQAIATYDSVRKDLEIESLASNFLEDKYEIYPSIIQLLAAEGKFREAFSYAEKYKAKNLLTILMKGRYLFGELLPDSIKFKFLEIRHRLNEAHAMLSEELANRAPNDTTILSLDNRITELELEKAALINFIREKFGSYYQLTAADPLSVKELQEEVLEENQLLIEFVVGPEKTSIFSIGRDTLIYQELPLSREALAQELEQVSALFRFENIEQWKNTNQIINADLANFSLPPAYQLYTTLLQPLEEVLNEVTELIIVPDDFLFYLPFEALVYDTSGVRNQYDFDHAHFLVEKYMISYVSSASLLNPALQPTNHPVSDLLALGNPDFGSYAVKDTSSQVSLRNRYLPLPNSEQEVKKIGALFSSSREATYTGAAATETVFKENAEKYRVLHLASHFVINDEDPLYSRVILAKDRDNNEDGFLQAYEVFNMKLNADLVVLSACNTALGTLRKGEGIVGITRAFLYAGIPSMVVSLWSVDDQATSEIMTNFYRYLKNGYRKNKALQLAKIDYLKTVEGEKKDPFYWAPFILTGDWEPLHFEQEKKFSTAFLIVLGVILVGMAFYYLNRRTKSAGS